MRAKIILEVLGKWFLESILVKCVYLSSMFSGAMRVVKYFSYEVPFLKRE